MRVVNGVEREVMRSEWENWLADENARCEEVKSVLAREGGKGSKGKGKGKAVEEGREDEKERLEGVKGWVEGYCGSCKVDMAGLRGNKKLEF